MFNEKVGKETDGSKDSQTNFLETYVNCLAKSLKILIADRRKCGENNLAWISSWKFLAEKRCHFLQVLIIQHFPTAILNYFFRLLLSIAIIDKVFQQDEVRLCHLSDFHLAGS